MSDVIRMRVQDVVNLGGSGSDEIWLPSVDEDGDLSWSKSSSSTPPEEVNIKGPAGADGAPGADGNGVKSLAVDENNHLITTYDDDTTEDAGEIDVTVPIDDTTAASNKVYSSEKVETVTGAKLANVYKGKNVVHMGDSWVDSFGIAEAAAAILGYTVTECGFTATSISDYNEALSNARYFSLIELAKAIRDNDWTEQESHKGGIWGEQLWAIEHVDWSNVDVLILSYGTNDYGAQNPLGDSSARDELSVCGALKSAISIFQNLNSNMEIICTTPCYRKESRDDLEFSSYAGRTLLMEYVYAIGMTCEALGIKCIDMRALSGINQYNANVCLLSDQLHPTDLGVAKWAHGFTDALQSGCYGVIDTSDYVRIEPDNLIFDSEKFTKHKQWNATYVHTNGKKYLCAEGVQAFRDIVFGKVFFETLPVGTTITINGYGLRIGETAHRIGVLIRNADFSSQLYENYKAAFSVTEGAISFSTTTTEEYTNCWVVFYGKQMDSWANSKALARDMKCTVTLPST